MAEQDRDLFHALAVALQPAAPRRAAQIVPAQIIKLRPPRRTIEPLVHLDVARARVGIDENMGAFEVARQCADNRAGAFRQRHLARSAALGPRRGADQPAGVIDLGPSKPEQLFAAEPGIDRQYMACRTSSVAAASSLASSAPVR
jgi:hypothetical protein